MKIEMRTGETRWGQKLYLRFPYNKDLIAAIKSLSWDTTHRSWTGKEWEFDLNSEVLDFVEISLETPIPDEIRALVTPDYGEPLEIFLSGAEAIVKGYMISSTSAMLDKHMSFRLKDVEYIPSFQNGEWDGFIRLFKTWDQSFPIGLLSIAEEIFKKRGIEYIIRDMRTEGDGLNLKWKGFDLRPYQQKAVTAAVNRGMGYIFLPTASGKTVIGLKLIHELSKTAVIFVHLKELLYQWKVRLEQSFGIEVGIVGDGHYEERDITVSMLQTATTKPLKNDYDIMIVDECHHIPAETFVKVAEGIHAKYRFGLSATPWREDNKDLLIQAQTGTVLAECTVEDMVKDGFLARPIFRIVDYPDTGRIWDDHYQAEYRNLVEDGSRNNEIVSQAKALYEKGYKIYVEVKRIAHGKALVEMLEIAGVNAVFLHGGDSTKKRQKILGTFETGDFVLVSTLIKEGVDLPAMNAVILAGGGKSGVQVIQVIGRALRAKNGRNEALVIDLFDQGKGKYVSRHYDSRQDTMTRYYGDLYDPKFA